MTDNFSNSNVVLIIKLNDRICADTQNNNNFGSDYGQSYEQRQAIKYQPGLRNMHVNF